MMFWTYAIHGEFQHGHELATMEAAQEVAAVEYAEYCQGNYMKYGAEKILLIEFEYAEDGEIVIHQRIDSGVEFEDCGSQYDQHNVMWNVI